MTCLYKLIISPKQHKLIVLICFYLFILFKFYSVALEEVIFESVAYLSMEKQHFTTEIASLLNPPLLTKFKQVEKDNLENVYASKKYPLGRSKLCKLSDELSNQKFGICTEQGDSASVLIYPSSDRTLYSVYSDKFRPPNYINLNEVPAAGIKIGGKSLTDNTGTEIWDLLHEIKNDTHLLKKEIKNIKETIHSVQYAPNSSSNYNYHVKEKQYGTYHHKPSLLDALWKLLKEDSNLNPTEFASFLKAYTNNLPRTFGLVDLQKMLESFGAPISLPVLEKVLGDVGVLEDGFIYADKFLRAIKEGYCVTRRNAHGDRRLLLNHPSEDSLDYFRTTASVIGDHNTTVSFNAFGIPSIRKDIRKPKMRKFFDFTAYGDIKDASTIIQPSLFEKYGVYDEDIGALRSKEEIKLILFKSGISFNDEMFNLVWKRGSNMEHASIGNIWNNLKNLCLSENKLFD